MLMHDSQKHTQRLETLKDIKVVRCSDLTELNGSLAPNSSRLLWKIYIEQLLIINKKKYILKTVKLSGSILQRERN